MPLGDECLPPRVKVRIIVSFYHDVCQGDFQAGEGLSILPARSLPAMRKREGVGTWVRAFVD